MEKLTLDDIALITEALNHILTLKRQSMAQLCGLHDLLSKLMPDRYKEDTDVQTVVNASIDSRKEAEADLAQYDEKITLLKAKLISMKTSIGIDGLLQA